jgi:hypothetical protein
VAVIAPEQMSTYSASFFSIGPMPVDFPNEDANEECTEDAEAQDLEQRLLFESVFLVDRPVLGSRPLQLPESNYREYVQSHYKSGKGKQRILSGVATG